MDDDNAAALAVLDLVELAPLPLVDDLPLVAAIGIDAAQDVHQRGFPRAVLADQRMDLAFFHL